jgi:hypothetical protein
VTKEEILKMAREAGEYADQHHEKHGGWLDAERHQFAALVAADERESCLAEIEQGIWFGKTTEEILDSIAAAIRARGQS